MMEETVNGRWYEELRHGGCQVLYIAIILGGRIVPCSQLSVSIRKLNWLCLTQNLD